MHPIKGVAPQEFVTRMVEHWTKNLRNIPNEALKSTWHQIASVFTSHIETHDVPDRSKEWTILSPPTGSGKSQSSIIYSSMLSSRPNADHPGLLVVTRQIDDCDSMAERINHYGTQSTAIAYHSKVSKQLNMAELRNWPVVIITHRAYEMALDFLSQPGRLEQTWSYFHEYKRNGKLPKATQLKLPGQNPFLSSRRLVIVDECLDIVEHHTVSLEHLRQTLAAIPLHVRLKHPEEITAIEVMIWTLEIYARASEGIETKELMHLVDIAHIQLDKKVGRENVQPDFRGLIEALTAIRFDGQLGIKDDDLNAKQRLRHQKLLQSLSYVYTSWAYYGKHVDHTMNTARLLVPEDIKGCVVMDATARTNIVYELHKESRTVEPPAGTRKYSNVNVHVTSGNKVGKVFMGREGKKLTEKLLANLNEHLRGRNVLIVTHKSVENHLVDQKTTFHLAAAHWGKVDGSNLWKDCDAVVIFGLPYLPAAWNANVFMALQGPQETQWLQNKQNREYSNHSDIRRDLLWGHMSTSVIQAINRVRCRKTIDEAGNCEPTDVFLMLSSDANQNQAILRDIKTAMPGISIQEDWHYESQGKKAKRSKWQEAFIGHFQKAGKGKYAKNSMVELLGMSLGTMSGIIKLLKDDESDLSKTMAAEGVSYKVEGKGQSRTAYFIKK